MVPDDCGRWPQEASCDTFSDAELRDKHHIESVARHDEKVVGLDGSTADGVMESKQSNFLDRFRKVDWT